MNSLKNILGCGIVYEHSNNAVVLTIYKFKYIYNKIIPLFNEYNIQGVKALDFQDFCKIAKLVSEKAHLTLAGLEKIREIKLNMNKGRYIFQEKLPLVR
jgi:diadenosine tetraphosphate (Ap4A) HIT family hydrolase